MQAITDKKCELIVKFKNKSQETSSEQRKSSGRFENESK